MINVQLWKSLKINGNCCCVCCVCCFNSRSSDMKKLGMNNYSLYECTNFLLILIHHSLYLISHVTVSKSMARWHLIHGPLTRYAKLRVAHAPGMPGTFSPPPLVSDPDMHQGTCLTHVPWCMPGSLTSGSLWNRWRRKRSRHSQRMRNPQFCVSGKRPMEFCVLLSLTHRTLIHGDSMEGQCRWFWWHKGG